MKKLALALAIVLLLGVGALYLVAKFAGGAGLGGERPTRPRPQAPTLQICTADAKLCPDGSSVGRDGTKNCEFFPCPETAAPKKEEDEPIVACTMDARVCPDGSAVGRDGDRGCAFQPCPGEGLVTGDVTLSPTCPYQRADEPCPESPYEGSLTITPVAGGVVTVAQVTKGRFYATLPAGVYEISSGRVLPRCDERFTVVAGAESRFAGSCDSGIR